MTNTFVLCVSLLTNSQQAVIGQTNGRALVVSQDTVVQRTVTVEDILLSSRAVTNLVPIAIAAPAPLVQVPNTGTNQYDVVHSGTPTNSPAYRRWQREQRIHGTNAPAK